MKNLCIYHASCADGFGAALAVKIYFDRKGEECEFIAAHYGDLPPNVEGKNVFIVDFSYQRADLLVMKQLAKSLVVLDHHKTAQGELLGIKGCYFDMNKSGAVMAWEYLFPNQELPILFNYIQDRDLWTWQLVGTKEISAALQSIEMTFENWEPLLDDDKLLDLLDTGKIVLNYQKIQVKRILEKEPEMVSILGNVVPCINTNTLISEVGHELCKGKPFAVMYFETKDKRVYSLRSDENGLDVSAIAKHFGGGGHKHAAGFSLKKPFVDLDK